jgi:DNA-binding MarR family transcriptional regulator
MAAIADVPGRTSKEVVALTPMDKGIVSRATKALLQMGLVRREASQLDGRRSHLFLTEPGQERYATIVPKVDAIVQDLDTGLDPRAQADLTRLLDTLIARVPDRR